MATNRFSDPMAKYAPTDDKASRGILLAGSLVVSAAGLFPMIGRLGLAVAFIGVAVALTTTGFYGVAVQHFAAIAVLDELNVLVIAALETAALFLLVSDGPLGWRLSTGSLFVPVAVILAVGTVSVAQSRGFVAASIVLVSVVGFGVYLLHRYASVRVGATVREPNQ